MKGPHPLILASTASQAGSQLLGVLEAVGGFVAILLIVFFIAGRVTGRFQRPLTILICVGPAIVLVLVGLVIPAILTVVNSFKNQQFLGEPSCPPVVAGTPCVKGAGISNYKFAFTDPGTQAALLHTVLWLAVVPSVTVAIGLVAALLMDRMKRTAVPKTLIFLPTAISLVGGSAIWLNIYNPPPTGLLSTVVTHLGWKNPPTWLFSSPANMFFEMVILIWIQAGFAMVVLNAALKAIPEDILEAARMDGATGFTLFRTVQVPMIRTTLIVVLTTIMIMTLKAFDIVYTLYNGGFNTQVLANSVYNDMFNASQVSQGSALAVILFVCVTPLVIFNIVQLRKDRAR
jgi:alpha-glucoside transport system permease protein